MKTIQEQIAEIVLGVGADLGDPTFLVGSTHTATVVITNLSPIPLMLNISIESLSGTPAGFRAFTTLGWANQSVPANGSKALSKAVVMAAAPGVDNGVRVTVEETVYDLLWAFDFGAVGLIAPSVGVNFTWD